MSGLGSGSGSEPSSLLATCAVTVAPCNLLSAVVGRDRVIQWIRGKMATNFGVECQYFYEDVVYRVDKKGNIVFGIVMENDDQDLSDESSDSEESPKRKKGEIRVVWHPSGVEELVSSKKVFNSSDNTIGHRFKISRPHVETSY